jgi:hypothetical protein
LRKIRGIVVLGAVVSLVAMQRAGTDATGVDPSRHRAPFGALVASHRFSPRTSWISKDALVGRLGYVADFGDNTINIYSRASLALVGQLTTGISAPYGLAVSDGNLYVVEQDFRNVAVFAKGAKRPKLLLFDTSTPWAVAVARDGTVYVGISNGYTHAVVDVFMKGSSNPTYVIRDPTFSNVWAVGLDASGNLYVGGQSILGGGQVSEFAPGSHGPGTNLNLKGLALPTTIAFDKAKNLLIADYYTSEVDVYAPGASSPSLQTHVNNVAYVARYSQQQELWAPTYGGATVNIVNYATGAEIGSINVVGAAVQLTGVAFEL